MRWVVPDLLPAGLSILAGASKAGKSWLCLWLCLQIARGGQVWGRQVSSQPVLYLCLEDTFNRIQSRLLQIDGEGGSPQPAVPDPQRAASGRGWRPRSPRR